MRVAAMALLLAGPLVLALVGCESSQDKSARLAKEAGPVDQVDGVTVTEENRDIRVVKSSIITDENGSAVVVQLKSAAKKPQADVPISLDVLDKARKSVFTNATPGLERSLTHAAVVPPGKDSYWVNDQVVAATPPESVTVKVGPAAAKEPPSTSLAVEGLRLIEDPVSGLAATGFVNNEGREDARRVVVTVVAEKGDKVVAAGRGVVARSRAGKRARFRIFFIGNPKGAELQAEAEAPVTT